MMMMMMKIWWCDNSNEPFVTWSPFFAETIRDVKKKMMMLIFIIINIIFVIINYHHYYHHHHHHHHQGLTRHLKRIHSVFIGELVVLSTADCSEMLQVI